MTLTVLDIINGSLSIVFVAISLLVGLIIFSRYFKYKDKVYLFVGATWIFISEPWWPSSLSFLIALNNGVGLPKQLYFLIGNALIPLAIALWLLAFTEFLYTEKRKIILIIFGIYSLIFEIFFFILLYSNPNQIGNYNPPVDVSYKSFIMIYLISFLLIVVVSGFLFARLSLKSDDPEVKLKGKLLIGAYITFLIGAILDTSISLNEFTIIITRLILIMSAFFWYAGFILPRWIKKFLLKQN